MDTEYLQELIDAYEEYIDELLESNQITHTPSKMRVNYALKALDSPYTNVDDPTPPSMIYYIKSEYI